ncbi:MAG: hypothetical protein IK093_07455, partial [Ruminiclostridium sp.]|nr:hypothetical protein [Ruminiclostridium sp.]
RTGYAFVYKLGRYATELVIMLTSASVIYLAVLHDPDFDTGLYGVAELVYDLLKVPSAVLLSTWLVINLIVFVIIELVSREKLTKPKKLGLAVLRFAASAGVSFLICFGVFSSDGFGAGAYVPGVSEIGSVGMYWYSSDMYAIDHYAEVKDESAVKLITDYHRRIIAERPDEYFNSLSLSYYMKNGEYVHRTYYLPTEYTLDCTKLWFESGAFAEGCKSRMPGYDAIPRLSVNVGTVGNINGEAVWTKAGIGANEFLTALTHDVEKTAYEDIFRHDGAGYIWVALLPENSITSQYKFQVWDTFEETRGLLRECNCDVFGQLLDDHAVKFYMYKATSLGDYTTKKKLMETVDIYGDTRVYDEPREYRELDYVTARELITKSAVMTMYSESRDIYIIVPSYEFLDENGEKYFRTGYSGDYEYYVTEANLDEAAGIYANAPAATDDELRKYLGVINNYTWGE